MAMSVDPVPESPPARRRASEWPAQAADTIVDVVGTAHQKTTGPALTVARGAVYGLLIAVVATMALVLLIVGVLRLMNNWLDVWLSYLILGALFVVGGVLCWRRRAPVAEPDLAPDASG